MGCNVAARQASSKLSTGVAWGETSRDNEPARHRLRCACTCACTPEAIRRVNFTPPPITTYVSKNTIATLGLIWSTIKTQPIFTSLHVAVTPEINMADTKVEVVSVWQVLLTFQRCKTAVVYFSGCRRHSSQINTVRIYCKSIFQDGDHKPEVLSVLRITFTAFAC